MSFYRNEETPIKVFHPTEILNNEKKESPFGGFRKNIEKIWKHIKINHRIGVYRYDSPYGRSVRTLWAEVKRQIIGTAATALVIMTVCSVVNLLDWNLGYEVIVDGENIGMVIDRQVVFDAIDEVREDVREHLGDDFSYEKEPAFVRRIVSEKNLLDKNGVRGALLSNVDAMVEGYAIYIDGEVAFGMSSEEATDWLFANYKKKYVGQEIAEDMSVEFCEDVEVRKEFMHIAFLKTPEEAFADLSEGNKEEAFHTVEKGDTLSEIAEEYDISLERILALNKGISDNLKIGEEIRVEEVVPLLSVRSVQTVSRIEPIPFEVEKVKDDTVYEGRTVISREGKEGEAKVLARITKVNGVETQKVVLESEALSAPVSQIEKIGTKERPATTGSGTFARPTYGVLSSRYGNRWNREHQGIDIAGQHNSAITAADGGIVTFAGWMSGYGNYVVINHENGYETAYGHCSSLTVSEGQRVAKGDLIARMGNTGRSTGTHLHFEVRKNGQFVNPLEYVGY